MPNELFSIAATTTTTTTTTLKVGATYYLKLKLIPYNLTNYVFLHNAVTKSMELCIHYSLGHQVLQFV